MPRVTVSIPSYNHEKYIAQTIQSVLDQTYQDFEIVITDDGSSDGTVNVIRTFTDPRMRLYCFDRNQGASIAMNNCIYEAKGDYIAVLNSDDLFLPDKLEKQMACLDKNPEIGAVFGYPHFIDEEGKDYTGATHPYFRVFKQPNRTRFQWLNHFFYEANALCHPSVLIRRECYEKVGYYDERLAQMPDFDFWIRLCMKYEIHVIPEYLIKFRVSAGGDSASGNRPEANIRLATEHTIILKNYLKIKSVQEFLSIFPEAKNYQYPCDEELIPFLVSMLALEKRSAIHTNFAVFALFDFLSDQNRKSKILEKCRFSVAEFLRITGKYDLYNYNVIREQQNIIRKQTEQLSEKEREYLQLRATAESQERELNRIHSRIGWILLERLGQIKEKLLPSGTHRGELYDLILSNVRMIMNKGWKIFFHKGLADDPSYRLWILQNEPGKSQLRSMKRESLSWSYRPKISIITPVYNPESYDLTECIKSVLNQVYDNWELCLVDGGSDRPYVKQLIKRFASLDRRIKFSLLPNNLGIAANSNEALKLATGEYVGFLDHDDMIAPFSLYEVVKFLNKNSAIDLLYSDEDKVPSQGTKRSQPFFKPDWSPDTLLSYNYVCHFCVVRKTIIDQIGGFRGAFEGSQDYDLILRVIQQTKNIKRIPMVLYHWRASSSSIASGQMVKPQAYPAAKRALGEYLKNRGVEAEVLDGYFLGSFRLKYRLQSLPKVCIIIPTRDKVQLLHACVTSILTNTDYANFEILIVNNASWEQETYDYFRSAKRKDQKISIIEYDQPFNFSAINNFAQRFTDAEYLLFLNNDTEVISNEWLSAMLEFAQREDVGAVGAKLYYSNNTIQHAGVVVGLGGIAGHGHKHLPASNHGNTGRINIIQNLSAVTAACMMIRTKVFQEVGGFDERMSHAFNDVDLCLKLRQKGYLVVYTPYAKLYHHESASRGYEDTPERRERFKNEAELFYNKWKLELETGDPYYNPNLSLDKPDYSPRIHRK